MKRLLFFLFWLALVIGVAAGLADRPGTAHIVWHDTVLETSASFLALLVVGIGFVFYFLFRVWHLLRHGPTHWRLNRKIKKMKQGGEDLVQGLAALAAGDAAEAGQLACRARSRLGATASTLFLQAQAAHMAGDFDTARELYQTLTEHRAEAMLGYRGLIAMAKRDQQWPDVERLIAEAKQACPTAPWVQQIRFEVLAQQKKWQAATLVNKAFLTARHRAAALVSLSQEEAQQNRLEDALETAEKAVNESGDWLPAIINLVARQTETGHRRAARHVIEKHWKHTPHPHLAEAFVQHEKVLDAYKNLEKLCRTTADNPTSLLALAETALAANLWGEARRHLMTLVGHGTAHQKAYRLLAQLEKEENRNDDAATRWLAKAIDAPTDPIWLCHTCGGTHTNWQALCGHCGAFDALDWRSPGVAQTDRAHISHD